jgi:hypothetical protein
MSTPARILKWELVKSEWSGAAHGDTQLWRARIPQGWLICLVEIDPSSGFRRSITSPAFVPSEPEWLLDEEPT